MEGNCKGTGVAERADLGEGLGGRRGNLFPRRRGNVGWTKSGQVNVGE